MTNPDCPDCGGTGWTPNPSACSDPEHCYPYRPCHCNPECEDEP